MISAVVHTLNEENNITRCLSSLSFADEIIVVDMGSKDGTVARVKETGARVYHHPYTGFVEPARNFALNKARGDWILVADADEEVPRPLSLLLAEIAGKNESAVNFYRIPRKNLVFGKWIKHAGWWPDYQIRFFRKGTISWIDKLHGVPITTGEGRELPQQEESALIHYHYQTVEQFLERMNRYSTIQAKEMYLSNRKFSLDMLMLNPANEFVRRFFLYEGYRDGLHGLSLSLLQALSETVVALKLWELSNFQQEAVNLDSFAKLADKESRLRKYWLYNELLKKKPGILRELIYRFMRKVASYA